MSRMFRMSRTRVPVRDLGAVTLAVLTSGLAGCYSSTDVSIGAIMANPSPELVGMSQRSVDIDRSMAVVGDQNLRLMWGDLGRVWLFDAPSTLSPWNTVSTSGQP